MRNFGKTSLAFLTIATVTAWCKTLFDFASLNIDGGMVYFKYEKGYKAYLVTNVASF
jgi:hypothetical protein